MDGFGAALSAWIHFKEIGELVTLIACNYNEPFPLSDEEIKDATIYVVDFSFPKEELIKANSLAKKIQILDHHQSAEKDLKDLSFAHFDMTQSGAMLAWKHFHPNKPVPKLIEYIQDRDLWKFILPNSKEVNASVQSNSIDLQSLNNFEKLLYDMEDPQVIKRIRCEGEAILRSQKQFIDLSLNRSTVIVTLGGHDVPACNTSIYESETASKLLDLYPDSPFSATFYYNASGEHVSFSLRCRPDFDVSEIAKLYNGGGHKMASGCKLKSSQVVIKKMT
jgi:oligoribonuclease NrnB/cAMP/cGMP phosphodiesterase (DHH superfamily)